MNAAKRSAASRKAWRTRKRMKAARQSIAVSDQWPAGTVRLEARAEALGNLIQAVDDRLTEKVKTLYEAETKIAYLAAEPWPEYMRRALPLPEFGKGK